MISESQVKELILKSLKKVKDARLVKGQLELNDDAVILAMGGPLDSIAFVAFVTDLEERIEDQTGKEFAIRLQEIHDLNEGKNALIVKDMARIVAGLINKGSHD